MSDLPFGFGQPDDDPERKREDQPATDPLAALFGGFGLGGRPRGPGGVPDLGAALQQIGKLLQWQGGPVNWDLARDMARQAAADGGDPTRRRGRARAVDEALRLAELWLDDATALPAATSSDRGLVARRVGRGDAAGVEGARRAGGRPGRRSPSGESMTSQVPAEMGSAGRPAQRHDALGRRGDVRRPGRAGPRLPGHRGDLLDRRRAAAGPARHRGAGAVGGDGLRRGPRGCRRPTYGSTSPCARSLTTGCSRTRGGCGPGSSTRSRATPAASTSTPPASRTR